MNTSTYLFEIRDPSTKNLLRTLFAKSFGDAAEQIGAKVTGIFGITATSETIEVMAMGEYGKAPLIVNKSGLALTH